MDKIAARLRAVYAVLEPKWRYIAESLAELLALLALILAGVLGFLPWLLAMGFRLLWRGICRLRRRIREESDAHGAAENTDE